MKYELIVEVISLGNGLYRCVSVNYISVTLGYLIFLIACTRVIALALEMKYTEVHFKGIT